VSLAAAEESIQKRAVLYDKDGDYHYDAASALIKSIRGSDPDAALYWLARMVYAGEDPRFAFRRMLISSCEDIGLADPNAVRVVESCAEAFDRIGMPEGQFLLSQAVLYLATAPKSNSTMGFFDALSSVEAEAAEVPSHLKDASRDKHGFGHGEGYLYPHAYRDHWVAQQYLPDSLRGRVFYQPGSLGLEGERRRSVLEKREAQVASLYAAEAQEDTIAGAGGDASVWSQEGEGKREWKSRAEGSAPARLQAVRRALYDKASPRRDDRVLVLDAREGYLVWEVLRRCPEGTVAAAASDIAEADIISSYATTLPEIERPLVAVLGFESLSREALETAFGFSSFDLVVGRDLFGPNEAMPESILPRIASVLDGSKLALVQTLPREGARLSELFADSLGNVQRSLQEFEVSFYGQGSNASLGLDRATLDASITAAGNALGIEFETTILRTSYPRSVSRREMEAWLSPASAYGAALAKKLSPADLASVVSILVKAAEALRRSLDWPVSLLYVSARFTS
jgi:putative ATPase